VAVAADVVDAAAAVAGLYLPAHYHYGDNSADDDDASDDDGAVVAWLMRRLLSIRRALMLSREFLRIS